MRSKAFWLDAAERAVRTFAQALVAVLAAGFVVTDGAAWTQALLSAVLAALVSVLTSIAGSAVGDGSTPSFLPEAQSAEPVDPDDY